MHTAADIPTTEPESFMAGDTVKWTKSLDHYSAADGWTLTYYLRGPSAQTITTTASGSDHAVSVAASVTALYVPGNYKLYGHVSKASERYQVIEAALCVLPNVATQSGAIDIRSDAKIIYEALLELAKQRASRPELAMSIQAAGRSFTYKSDADIQKAINYWGARVAEEDNPSGEGKTVVCYFA